MYLRGNSKKNDLERDGRRDISYRNIGVVAPDFMKNLNYIYCVRNNKYVCLMKNACQIMLNCVE